ncbi:MAG: polysulfide reductase NrfD [Bacteroidia bacterium]|nr:polysulfide reductase NrfD [Bacteroidia bacterium]
MKYKIDSNQIQEDLSWISHPPSKLWWSWIIFLLLCIAIGMYALYLQIAEGHIVTGMRDNVVWGIYIANFIFFLGLSYAGAIIGAFFHLFKVPWRRPIIRISSLIAVIGAIVGPVFILLCIGRLDRLHYLFIHARIQSPIIWDVFAISTYIVAAILFLYLGVIKDFAVFRDSSELNFSRWRRKFYNLMAINYQGKEEQKIIINKTRNLLAIILVPMVVIISSILSWIFGMTLRPGWHSTIFGPYFVLAAIYSGTGAIIVAMWIFRKMYNLKKYFTDRHFVYMGVVLIILGTGYGYFTFSEYLTSWYASDKWDSELIDKLLDPEYYGVWFFISNVLGILIPIIVMVFKKLRTPGLITLASVIVLISLWIKRYLIVVPTLETTLIPIQDIRPEYLFYSPTWVEYALTLAGFASFFLFISLASRFITIIPMSELAEEGGINIY